MGAGQTADRMATAKRAGGGAIVDVTPGVCSQLLLHFFLVIFIIPRF